jgi:tetratricopeptide (TPR) repeat protein
MSPPITIRDSNWPGREAGKARSPNTGRRWKSTRITTKPVTIWVSALTCQGKLEEAVAACDQSLKLKPDNARTHNNLGVVLLKQQNAAEAIQHFQQALQAEPAFAERPGIIGEQPWPSQGKWTEALIHFHAALPLAQAQNNTNLIEAIRLRLETVPPAGQASDPGR